jgi:hypothetical protein
MYLFDGGLFIPKFSMLAFYIRIIPATSPKMRKGLWAVVCFVTAAAITAYVAITFWCGTEIAINWSDKPEACSAFSARPLGQLTWSLNIISEIFSKSTPRHFAINTDVRCQYFCCHYQSSGA